MNSCMRSRTRFWPSPCSTCARTARRVRVAWRNTIPNSFGSSCVRFVSCAAAKPDPVSEEMNRHDSLICSNQLQAKHGKCCHGICVREQRPRRLGTTRQHCCDFIRSSTHASKSLERSCLLERRSTGRTSQTTKRPPSRLLFSSSGF